MDNLEERGSGAVWVTTGTDSLRSRLQTMSEEGGTLPCSGSTSPQTTGNPPIQSIHEETGEGALVARLNGLNAHVASPQINDQGYPARQTVVEPHSFEDDDERRLRERLSAARTSAPSDPTGRPAGSSRWTGPGEAPTPLRTETAMGETRRWRPAARTPHPQIRSRAGPKR